MITFGTAHLPSSWTVQKQYRQTSNISRTLVGSKIADHLDVLEHRLLALLHNYIHLHSRLTPGFNGLGKDNHTTGRETFKFLDLVRFILEIWR